MTFAISGYFFHLDSAVLLCLGHLIYIYLVFSEFLPYCCCCHQIAIEAAKPKQTNASVWKQNVSSTLGSVP